MTSRRPRSDRDGDVYSAVQTRHLDGDAGAPYAFIAPADCPQGAASLPTVLAISGEEQLHVSRFFRAWRAEERGWQVVVPLRRRSGLPYLFEKAGVDFAVALMQRLVTDADCKLLPQRVQGQKFHLVGTSNGGAAVLAAAAQAPELVASLTLVTGFCPKGLADFAPLKVVPSIRLYAGDLDELGHCEALARIKEKLDLTGAFAELFILEGARHGNVGHFIDMEEFWRWLAAHCVPDGAATALPPTSMPQRRWPWQTVAAEPAAKGRAGPSARASGRSHSLGCCFGAATTAEDPA